MVGFEFVTTTVGRLLTVTVTVLSCLQLLASVAVTVYVRVDRGEAVTVVPVVALSFVFGAQAYDTAPLAVSDVD